MKSSGKGKDAELDQRWTNLAKVMGVAQSSFLSLRSTIPFLNDKVTDTEHVIFFLTGI